MKWKLLVHETVQTQVGLKYPVLFFYGDVEWGSRWLGLKEILIEKLKLNVSIPQLGWLCFYGCQLLCASPTPCERWPTFVCSQSQLHFFSWENSTFN